jgi:hypothetical protein
MKKVLSLMLTLILVIVLVFAVTTTALADSGGATASQPDLVTALIVNAVDIINTLILAAFGVIGTWVSLKFAATDKLKTVGAAWDEAVKAAKLTVGELKQTVADNIKASRADGKLTKAEIDDLQKMLFEKAKEKMSQPAYDILLAASVDVQALILGAGEAWIEEIKRGTFPADVLLSGVPVAVDG